MPDGTRAEPFADAYFFSDADTFFVFFFFNIAAVAAAAAAEDRAVPVVVAAAANVEDVDEMYKDVGRVVALVAPAVVLLSTRPEVVPFAPFLFAEDAADNDDPAATVAAVDANASFAVGAGASLTFLNLLAFDVRCKA